MANKFKEQITVDVVQQNIPNPIDVRTWAPNVWDAHKTLVTRTRVKDAAVSDQEGQKRALHFNADMSGCGWWRMELPSQMLNYTKKMCVNTLTAMVYDPRFYNGVWDSIKLQRQATRLQLDFVDFLSKIRKYTQTKIIYEVDDVCLDQYIPDYNGSKHAFTSIEIQKSIRDILDRCDELLVVSPHMAEVYKSEMIGHKNVSVVRNYAPKWWFDGYYNQEKRIKNFDLNKNRPRVLATASSTHHDPKGFSRTARGDYTHLIDTMIKTRKDFKWVWMGSYPLYLKPFIDNGDMELIPWQNLFNFPKAIDASNAQVTIAGLEDNVFNRSKSDIKFTEASYLGLPFVGQDLEPYKESYHLFNTGDEMIDRIKSVLSSEDLYLSECEKARSFGETKWLDDHLDNHMLIYNTPYGDPSRKLNESFLADNLCQF